MEKAYRKEDTEKGTSDGKRGQALFEGGKEKSKGKGDRHFLGEKGTGKGDRHFLGTGKGDEEKGDRLEKGDRHLSMSCNSRVSGILVMALLALDAEFCPSLTCRFT